MARQRLWWLGALMVIGLAILISSNSAQWVFLARVQWVALLGLTILPLLAHTSGRELLIGAYDLNSTRAGFHVGLMLILVATSILDTALCKRTSRHLFSTLGSASYNEYGPGGRARMFG
jgi:hypothetical protein